MREVVVGVSPTSGSADALRAAQSEAQWRGCRLVAVQAWRPPRAPAAPGGHIPAVSIDTDAAYETAHQNLTRHVADVLGADASASCRVVRGLAASVLLSQSHGAELLVVNAPSRRALTRSPLLAQRLIAASTCPVLIVPPPAG